MTLAKEAATKSMFATAETVANSDDFTETRGSAANRAGAGRHEPLIGFSQGS